MFFVCGEEFFAPVALPKELCQLEISRMDRGKFIHESWAPELQTLCRI